MAHLIDPCLRATKIVHGIRRGIDGLSPLSGLVPELRILIQEQKNVLTSLKRTAFEKEEAAKHLSLYAKTEGPDINDTLSKLSILIQKAADLERAYANSLGQSRELFKEIRVAEDENYSVRKRKLDLEQKIIATTGPSSIPSSNSTSSLASSLLPDDKTIAKRAPELHKEMKLLRQETITVENDLEDMKRKKLKKATFQQLDALEKMGKELIVIAAYGKKIMSHLDDSPTPAGIHADERYNQYDGEAKTAYALKACLDTFKEWSVHAPKVHLSEMDLGNFPRDNKQAMDAMLQDLAIKSGSDWYALQTPSTSSLDTKGEMRHGRSSSVSSTTSSSVASSHRASMSSPVSIITYMDGVPMVNVINEIPPTPKSESGPVEKKTADATPIFIAGEETQDDITVPPEVPSKDASPSSSPVVSPASVAPPLTGSPAPPAGDIHPSPFIPHSTYTPSTTYQPSPSHSGRNSPGHVFAQGQGQHQEQGRFSPPRSRPVSDDYSSYGSAQHAPHPLMMKPASKHSHHQQQQYQQQPYPTHMPVPMPVTMTMPMPMSMPMPVPHIPDQPGSGGNKRHSQPISVSFPILPPPPPPHHYHDTNPMSSSALAGLADPSITSSSAPPGAGGERPNPRAPHAVLPPTEPGFRIPVGAEPDTPVEEEAAAAVYDGPPPDYVENTMSLPSEKTEEKRRLGKK
ncbi:hypothetical protein BG006_002630 [Podila minutissima]|uniref:Eisosome component PIL1-domain-containing protein n=1 Tax=Podila minutissima TaxID=64525 RepID=A0A9P5SQG3_9FUNG|nr:hypothetical protein BG006_002630 [Podila minutissima]